MSRRYDPNDPDMVAERQQAVELRAAQEQADLEWLASAPQGRRLLSALFGAGGLMQSSFVPGDALASAFSAGRHSLALDAYLTLTGRVQAHFVTALLHEVFTPHGRGRPSTRSN